MVSIRFYTFFNYSSTESDRVIYTIKRLTSDARPASSVHITARSTGTAALHNKRPLSTVKIGTSSSRMVDVIRQSKELTRRVATRVNSLSQPILIKKRALLIGIRYGKGEEGEDVLMGPHSDVDEWKKLLIGSHGYREEDVIVMKDTEEVDSRFYPTHANIKRVLTEEFILKGEKNVNYFFLYAGHSDQVPCLDGTEEDNLNEHIIPVDAFDKDPIKIDHNRIILDDILKQVLVVDLPPRCKLVALLDTCHSGTLMDLYHFRCNRIVSPSSNVRRIHRKFLETWTNFVGVSNGSPETLNTALRHANQIFTAPVQKTIKAKTCSGLCLRSRTYRPDVVCISACRDRERAWEENGASVAKAMIECLKHDPNPTYKDLMRNITDSLQARNIELSKATRRDNKVNKQHPELCSEVPLHMDDRLCL